MLAPDSRDPRYPLVIDSWRHRQLHDANVTGANNGPVYLTTLESTLSCLREDQQGVGSGFAASGFQQQRGQTYGLTSPSHVSQLSPGMSPHMGHFNLGDVRLSSGTGILGAPLDVNVHSALQPHRTIAELSIRRKEAIRSAFHRIDVKGEGWVNLRDVAYALQRFSNLKGADQDRVVRGMSGGGVGPQVDFSIRISFSQFAAYYQVLSNNIERDRDFEDMMRHHWGFPEVSDILDDMKNRFATVGLAYAFRRGLVHGQPEMSLEAFQDAVGQLGMHYSNNDVRRLFDSFNVNGGGGPPSLEVLRLTQHLTSAPRPSTPISSLYGTAHISEVNSVMEGGDISNHTPLPSAGFPNNGALPVTSGFGVGFGVEHSAQLPGYGANPQEASSSKLPPPKLAPPEAEETATGKLPPPEKAPEEDTHACSEGTPLAPPETGTVPPGPAPLAPPEDDFGEMAPSETLTEEREAPMAPQDRGLSYSYHAAHGHHGGYMPHQNSSHHYASHYQSPYSQHTSHYNHHHNSHHSTSYHQDHYSSHHSSSCNHHHQHIPYSQDAGQYSSGPHHISAPAPSHHTSPPHHISAPAPSHYQNSASHPTSPMNHLAVAATGVASPGSAHPPHVAASLAAATVSAPGGSMGVRRAVTVGINYLGQQCKLAGCINDSDTFISLLTEQFGFSVGDIRQLRDDHPQRMPTKKNMTAALKWLVTGAKEGDHLFFHYSGHGSQQRDNDRDEMDGKDETLVPCDYQHHGMISDDDLRRLIVLPLNKGVRLTVILDCCHSGTGLDLPYKIKVKHDNSIDIKKKMPHQLPKLSEADVIMLSGCKDAQTSADIGAGSAGNTKAAGAMTTAFKTVITRKVDISYHGLILEMRRFLKCKRFDQVPQLSSEHFLNVTECFMPEVQQPDAEPEVSLRPPVRKAVTIGINYLSLRPGKGRLAGCINDSDTIIGVLKDVFQFGDKQIHRLRDDQPDAMPTKTNMLSAFRWLTQGAANGDEMFLHYSGHGGQQRDANHDEIGGKDDTLIPCDFQTNGQIIDDDLYALLVDNLPKGCRMWVVFDCCHSGTALDLPFKLSMAENGRSAQCTKTRSRRAKTGHERSKAEVVMLSGCKDSQTSADVSAGAMGVEEAAGAMTTAFRHTISPTTNCDDLLIRMRQFLKRHGYKQVPQLSSEQFLQLDSNFVNYATRVKGKRGLPPSPFSPPHVEQWSPMPATRSMDANPFQGPSSMDARMNEIQNEINVLRQQQAMQFG